MSKKEEAEAWITEHPGGTASELAEELDINNVYAGQVLAKLFEAGLATREKGEGTGSAYQYYVIDPEERTAPPLTREKKEPTDSLPTSIKFQVVAELKNGGLLLQYKGDFFVARMVDLADIVRI